MDDEAGTGADTVLALLKPLRSLRLSDNLSDRRLRQ